MSRIITFIRSVIFKQGGWSGLGAGGERIYSIVLSCRIIDGEYGSKGASCAREYGGLGANGAWVMERKAIVGHQDLR
ncbi:MAG: hypothetical protein WBM86_26080, partial [Waterburya sp.]